MSDELPAASRAPAPPPVSSFSGPIAELVAHRMLNPPPRPGLLASLDDYEILRLLGSGGMGIVLLARDTRTGEEVAIKLIRPELSTDSGMRHRFIKEAEHMQHLRHPNIVPIRGVSDSVNGPYFVMPYFKGGNLLGRLASRRVLPRDEVLDLAQPLAAALLFAHRRGIIHRDLKPGNVLLSGGGAACLADFGLARTVFNDTVVDPAIQQCEGTAAYMSPGVAVGDAEDTRCDIYAWGALLYEIQTGEPPYAGASATDIRRQIIAAPPAPIRLLNPNADPGLVTITEGAMGRKLRERYADMADVVDDLRRVREGKRPFGPGGLPRRVRRRLAVNRRLVVGTGLFALIGAGIAFLALNPRGHSGIAPDRAALSTQSKLPAALRFHDPIGVVTDRNGILYVADNADAVICQVSPQGKSAVLAGLRGQPGTTDGTGFNARFSLLRGLAVGSDGSLYATDGFEVRKVALDGGVRTIAGDVGISGANDGFWRTAHFQAPGGIAADGHGNLYVADMYTIRKISADGEVTTLAGLEGHAGATDGPRDQARFGDQFKGIAVDRWGNIFVADSVNCEVRRVTPSGNVTTIAGSFEAGFSDGPGREARFNRPSGVAVDARGILYVADTGNHVVRVVGLDGSIGTLAGQPGRAGNRDGQGSAALFAEPRGIAMNATGTIYVCDTGSDTIRKVSVDGAVTTIHAQP